MGRNEFGQCNIPALGDGLEFTQISAGGFHTVFICSDGTAVACGQDGHGQCSLPSLEDGITFAPSWFEQPDLIVQLGIDSSAEAVLAVCRDLSGEQIASLVVPKEDQALPVHCSIGKVLVS